MLRVVLGEVSRLREWPKITTGVSSELIRVECLRTIDRARLRLRLTDRAVSRHRADVLEVIDGLGLIPLDSELLARAAEPFPTLLGTLDAVHLASALAVREELEDLSLASHDDELAVAARAVGFRVLGSPPLL